MKNSKSLALLFILNLFLNASLFSQDQKYKSQEAGNNFGDELGTVAFRVECEEEAKAHFERGLALLHHMTYKGARAEFATVTEVDPGCAMGYWGQAMTYIHPLWSDPPSEDEFMKGKKLLEKAKTIKGITEREQAFINAAYSYYQEDRSRKEKANLVSFEKGWRNVYEQFSDDPEATAFYALAHMATADPEDKTLSKQKHAASIAKKILDQIPDHPGAHHYTIHALDYPPLAEEALDIARSYKDIAPDIPHALHMPTHIFTRMGLWDESIEMNKRSAQAALNLPGEKLSLHYLHALDYLVYAYLQQGEDQKAEEVLTKIQNLDGPFQNHIASAYTFAAVPARMALERQQWEKAAQLEPRMPKNFEWDNFPAMEAITHFARALGSVRTGEFQAARQELNELEELRKKTAVTSDYWAKQIAIQRKAAQAWLQYEQGIKEAALEKMKEAAELEAETEKHPVTPGEVIPASELLADMYREMGEYSKAHEEYLNALNRSPNRFNSLYGAGRSAELNDDPEQAVTHYQELVEIATNDKNLERLQIATAYLNDEEK